MTNQIVHSQYFTPSYAAKLIYKHYFSDLTSSDVVLEPTCGDGAFLSVIPIDIQAFGVEIDPVIKG